ncbi:MAG: DUF2608 domain-containing protein [Elusimicrobia bacterium]|nr:DUF2608 domain-containing protein [Elusimicrobiota bacterium]
MKRLLALAALLLASTVSAEVREIKSMAALTPEVKPRTIVVFDIDNTLIEPLGNIGSDQWYEYLLKAYKRDANLSDAEAEAKAVAAWTDALGKVRVKPVETLTPPLVAALQKDGIKVMALTARGREYESATLTQLKAVGIDLSGILFAGEADKGKVLAAFIKDLKLKPARVVFADDKPHHARNVDAALTASGIPVLSLRYGAADSKVDAFNQVMAEADTAGNAQLLFHGPR